MRQELDLNLLSEIRRGNERAFSDLMNYYQKYVFRTIVNIIKNEADAEDLTIEVFEKIYLKNHLYQPTSSFDSWLKKLAKNHCFDFLSKKRIKFKDVDFPMDYNSEYLNPEEELINNEQCEILLNKIKNLQENYRIILELKCFEELSYKEISKQLNIPINTVCAHIFRARQNLNKNYL